MKRTMKAMVATLIVLTLGSSAWAADSIFLSTSNTNPTAGSAATFHSITGTGANRTLYVWVTSNTGDDITPPDTGFTNGIANSAAAIAYSVARSTSVITTPVVGNPAVLSLTGASDINAAFTGTGATPTTNVWDQVSNFASGNANVTATLISDVNAVVLPVTTPVGLNRGFALTQSVANVTNPQFNSAGNAFLLGQINFTTTGYGTSTIALQASGLKIIKGSTDLTNTYTYGTANITVSQLVGDTNGDGLVNLQDLLNVKNFFGTGTGTPPIANDTNGDGSVNLQDLLNVKNFFGTGNGSGGGASAVPEPASLALMGFAGLALLAARVKRSGKVSI
jgi:Dockerin type I domain/PEP-CTERM motif